MSTTTYGNLAGLEGPDLDRLERVHLNVPQLKMALIDAAITVCMWGRGTGKTEGPMSMFTIRNVHRMPRSNGFLVGATYEQLLTRTLPPLLAAWQKYGYVEGQHYWVRKAPPAKLRVPQAYIRPLKYDHYIQTYTGTGIYLISQDRPGTGNGLSVQWGAGDEARLLNGARLQEDLIPTLRGMAEHFAHLSCYLSLLFCTDRPMTTKSNWLYEYEAQHDEELIAVILALAIEAQQITADLDGVNQHGLITGHVPVADPKALARLREIERMLTELRRDTVYFSEASTLDNIHALGINPIKGFKRTLSDVAFQTSILNRKVIAIENGFYPLLDDEHHGYFASNIDHIESLDFQYSRQAVLPELDCRADSDVQTDEILDVAMDYNNAINSLVVGQAVGGSRYNLLNSMFVLGAENKLLKDAVRVFCRYYRFHRLKVVRYYYNHTAVAKSAASNVSFKDLVIAEFRDNGWEVIPEYLGQASSHHSRYLLWNDLLDEGSPDLPVLRFNRTRCESLLISMHQAAVKRAGDFFQKDKGSEDLRSGVKPQHATHLSEAADDLIWGSQRAKLRDTHRGDHLPAVVG